MLLCLERSQMSHLLKTRLIIFCKLAKLTFKHKSNKNKQHIANSICI